MESHDKAVSLEGTNIENGKQNFTEKTVNTHKKLHICFKGKN